MTIRMFVLGLCLVAALCMAETTKYICQAKHLGISAVAVICTNGADPTGTKQGDILIISCDSRGNSNDYGKVK